VTPAEKGALITELIADEGLKYRVYKDSLGIETIGIGRNIRDKGLSRVEILFLAENDIHECEGDLRSFDWFSALDTVRRRACLNLRFNLGPGRLRTFTKFLAAMAAQQYDQAADELVSSRWYQQVQPSRRDRIVRQIRTGQ
jgi:lysozyme